MFIKKAMAALCITLLGLSAQAGVISSKAVGVITSSDLGFDSVFGAAYANGSLNGMTYSMTISFDDAGGTYYPGAFTGQIASGNMPITISMTINNMTHVMTHAGSAHISMDNALSGGVPDGDDDMNSSAHMLDYTDYNMIDASQLIYSLTNPFVGASNDPRTNMTRTPQAGDVARINYWWTNIDGNGVVFDGTITSLTLDYIPAAIAPAAVPEPGTMAVFGIGLLAFAAARNKSRTKRA